MNHEDPIPSSQEPLVVNDGIPRSLVTESNFGTFAKVIKGVMGDVSSSRDRHNLAWESLPGVKEIAARRTPTERTTPPESLQPSRRSEGTTIDLNALRSELGDLLAADPVRPEEARSTDSKSHSVERPPVELARSPGLDIGRRDAGADSRPALVDLGGGRVPKETVATSNGPLISRQGVEPGHPGTFGLMTLAASKPRELLGLMTPADSESIGRDAGGVPDLSETDNARESSDEPANSISLPPVNPIADQLALASGAIETSNRLTDASPYSVDVRDSSVMSTAFGPVLSGPAGQEQGDPSALPAFGGQQSASPGLWSVAAGSESSDGGDGQLPDLSRTNDLLQQLLDEVRKGRSSFLPLNDRNSTGF